MKIPVYEQQTTTQAISNVQPVAATQSVDVSQGLGQLAAGIGQIGSAMAHNEQEQQQQLAEMKKQSDTAYGGMVSSQFQLTASNGLQDAMQNADPSGNGFYDNYYAWLQKQKEQVLNSTSDEQQKQIIQPHLDSIISQHAQQGYKRQVELNENYKISNLNRAQDNRSQSIYGDSKLLYPYLHQTIEEITKIIKDPLKQQEAIKSVTKQFTDAQAAGMIARDPEQALKVFSHNPESFTTPEEKSVATMANKYGVNPVTAIGIMTVESGLSHNVPKNPDSSAAGIGQVLDKNFYTLMGKDAKRGDPELEMESGIKLMKELNDHLAPVVGHDLSPGELRTAYHVGESNYKKLLANPNAKMKDVLSAKEIKANPHLKDMSLSEYVSQAEKNMNKVASKYHDTKQTAAYSWSENEKHRKEAQTAVDSKNAVLKTDLENKVSSDTALAMDGKVGLIKPFTESYFNQVYKNPAEAKIKWNEYKYALGTGDMIVNLQGKSIPEIQERINNFKPDETSPHYDIEKKAQEQYIAAGNQIIKQYNEDPVSYLVANNLSVQMAKNKAIAAKGNNAFPNFFNSASSFQLNNTKVANPKDEFYTAIIAGQQQMSGDSNTPVRLLTKNQENQVVAQMAASKGSEFTNNIKQLQDGYGKNWPLVARQLSQNKAYPAMANVIANINNLNTADKLANVSGMPITELYKNIPKQQELEGFKAAVNDNLADFIHSLPQGATRDGITSTYNEAVQRVALSYIQGGTSQGEAIKKATNEVLNDQYAFVPNSNKSDLTMRIPKSSPKDDSADVIASGAERYIKKIGDVPLTYVNSHEKWPDSKDLKANTISNIQDNGYWVTNDDETGMYLYTVDDNNIQKPVLNATGKPVNLTWDQLKSADQ